MTEAVRASRLLGSEATSRQLGLPGRLLLMGVLAVGAILAAPGGFGLFWFIPYAGVGTLLAIRRPRTSIGWILLALGWFFVLVTLPIPATPEQIATGGGGPLVATLAVASGISGYTLFFLFALLAIVFPSGHLPGGRWGVVVRLLLGIAFACVVIAAFMPTISVSLWGSATVASVPNPLAVLPDLPVWNVITPDTAILPVAAVMIAAVVSLLVRFRRATGVERQQLRWLTAALALVVTAVVAGWVLAGVLPGAGESGVAWLAAMLAFPCVPVAIGIAVLRYRLYEIDRIVSRTLGWALVTGMLAAVFTAVVVALQAVLSPVTESNTLAVAASTLVASTLFLPLRRRVQRAVDRRFDRARYDGERTVAAFTERLRGEVSLAHLQRDAVATVGAALRPTSTGLWIRGSEG